MLGTRTISATVCALVTLPLGACSHISSITIERRGDPIRTAEDDHRNGPPDHAPAHGYRAKHRAAHANPELRFDSDLGVYVVVGFPNRYYWDGLYLRLDGEQWYASARLDGEEWAPQRYESLPPGLQSKGPRPGKSKKTEKSNRGQSKKAAPASSSW